MKIILSDRAASILIALHQQNAKGSSITHYLNCILTDYQLLLNSIPLPEDQNHDTKNPHLPPM